MKQIVLGTAGHIDHGKTSLIRALSGIDTDRLKEEKHRGITIELGFAHLNLPSGEKLGIIDVPGHEKFVKNMVSGATGIDMVALIIAADEGVMPQTKEHLEICQLLDIHHGLVVLTKIDMVEEEWLELVREDVTEYLEETFLAEAPMVEVSAVSGAGLDQLVEILESLVKQVPERHKGHIFRLPADRVFSMKGFGTVVTGTTVSGSVKTGEEITIYPQQINTKIRGIQVHNQEVKEVQAGLRTAINLQALEKSAIERGNILATRDSLRPTYMVDVTLLLLQSAPRKLKNRAKVRLHTGTSEIISTVILLDRDELKPGEDCYAQIRLDHPTAVLRDDRYVLRSYSPVRTIGGGRILNALPRKKKRFSKEALKELEYMDRGELKEIIEVFIALGRFQGLEESALSFLTNTSKSRLDEFLKPLKAQKKIIQYDKEGKSLIHSNIYEKAKDEILQAVSKYHEVYPLKSGIVKEELRSRTFGSRNQKLFHHLMNELTKEGLIVQDKETVRLETHQVSLAGDHEQTRSQIEALYQKGGLQPPYFSEIKDQFPGNTGAEVLDVMVKEGLIVKIKQDLYFHKDAIENLRKRLVAFLKEHGTITTPQFKELTGASRKYTIPLIEYFDRIQVTVRVGDNRVLRKK